MGGCAAVDPAVEQADEHMSIRELRNTQRLIDSYPTKKYI